MDHEICRNRHYIISHDHYCVYATYIHVQMAFSYIWMQVVPRTFVKAGVPQVQAVQNVLLGRKRFIIPSSGLM